ncbi:2724_t:CDS:1, partial [Dentiscutata heterogama]
SSSKSQSGKHDQLSTSRRVLFRKLTAIRPASQLNTKQESAP